MTGPEARMTPSPAGPPSPPPPLAELTQHQERALAALEWMLSRSTGERAMQVGAEVQRSRAILSTLQSLPERERLSGWQTMETAPRDGHYVLIWCDGVYVARYDDQNDLWYFPEDGCAVDPTHWMPLPAPPAIEGDHHGR